MPAPDPPDVTDDPQTMTPPALSPLRAAPRPRPRPVTPASVVGRPHNEGHGKRLTAAFEALEVFPALAESRNRLLALIAEERLEAALQGVVEGSGAKPRQVFQPIRVALAGGTVSPGIFETLRLLGRDESLQRIDAALNRLSTSADTR